MAGHSKWSNIKHKKGRADAQRSKIFSKLAREITVAARLGGEDPDMNPRLRLAIDTAKSEDMPKANIENAIQKGVGGLEGEDYEEMRYEGYGPGGVAFIVDTLTDNKNRTAGDVRACFTKYGGNLGETGSVGFMFERLGQIIYPAGKADPETVFEAAVEAGAMNVESDADMHDITCAADDFADVREAIVKKFGDPEKSGLIWHPNTTTEIDEGNAASVLKLIEALEDIDDVQHVTTNFETSDEVMEKLTGDGR